MSMIRIGAKMPSSLYVLFGVVAVLILIEGCSVPESVQQTQGRSYDRVTATRTLRVAYISYPPSMIVDPNTSSFSGIFHDVLQEMAARMQLKVEYVEETSWGTMIEAVKSGRVDLVSAGIWPNSQRGRLVGFTEPLYYSPIRAFVRTDDVRFDGDLSKINDPSVKVSTIDGEMSSVIADADYPSATIVGLPQSADVAQMLLEVTTGKSDVAFVEVAVANRFLRTNQGSIRSVASVPAVRVFPNAMIVPIKDHALQSMLNTSIDELHNNGILDRIISKYEGQAGEFLRRANNYEP